MNQEESSPKPSLEDIEAARAAARGHLVKELAKSLKKSALKRGKVISSKAAREIASAFLEETVESLTDDAQE